MNKLILSAFAMSLMIVPLNLRAQLEDIDDFMGLETDLPILPVNKGPQILNPPDLHDTKVADGEAPEPAFGKSFSNITWSGIDTKEFLSISKWINEQDLKDQNPDWKLRLRSEYHQELMGKILHCSGSCEVYRGSEKARVQHLSQMLEGDEIHIGKDSLAWIFFMDGSLLRLSAESSLSFLEINFSASQVFMQVRLNQGHVFWHPRQKKEFVLEDGPETDSLSIPLMVRAANQQAFERKIFRKQKDRGHLDQMFTLNADAISNQFKFLNDLVKTNNPQITIPSKFMLVAPNASVISKDGSFDLVYLPGGNSYFRPRDLEEGKEFSLHLRGYATVEPMNVTESKWMEIDKFGRSALAMENSRGPLEILQLLTKRIKSVETAREIWVRDFTVPMMQTLSNPDRFAREHGYLVWKEDLERRISYLVEYTRRIETTNLQSIENLLEKMQKKGETVTKDISPILYENYLNHYLFGLKKRYDKKNMRVKEFTDLQYYVWILRNGKY